MGKKFVSSDTEKTLSSLIWIFVIAFACVIAVMFIWNALNNEGTSFKETKTETGSTVSEQIPSENIPNADYTGETNYKGNLSEYPDLYEIPFQKSGAYINNKEYSKGRTEILAECEEKATDFFEKLFNVDYREVSRNRYEYVASVMMDCEYDYGKTKNYGQPDEETIYFYDYIMEISEYMVDNQVQMEAKFYTDDSLVYYDYFTFVRGELVFTVYGTSDENNEYEIGKEYRIPMEAAMELSPHVANKWEIVSFGRADDSDFFINP